MSQGPDTPAVLPHLFALSAPTVAGLLDAIDAQIRVLESAPGAFPGTAEPPSTGEHGPARLALVAGGPSEARERLAASAARIRGAPQTGFTTARGGGFAPSVTQPLTAAFLFPGQGALYPGMFADLLPALPRLGAALSLLDATVGPSSTTLLPSQAIAPADRAPEGASAALHALSCGGLAALVAGLSLAELLERVGVRCAATLGHSNGELSALGFAGAFGSRELPHIIRYLGEAAWEFRHVDAGAHAGGVRLRALLATDRPALDRVLEQFRGQVHVMLDNCPRQLVVHVRSGVADRFDDAARRAGALVADVPFAQAYHSPLLRPLSGRIEASLRRACIASPEVPVYSAATCGRFPTAPADIAALAAKQWVTTVRFGATVAQMQVDGIDAFIDIGPQALLSGFVDASLPQKPRVCVSLDHREGAAPRHFLQALGRLFVAGAALDLAALASEWGGGGQTPMGAWAATVSAVRDARHAPSAEEEGGTPAVGRLGTAGEGARRSALIAKHFGLMRDFIGHQTRLAEAVFRPSARPNRPPAPAPAPSRPGERVDPLFDTVVATADGVRCRLCLTSQDAFLRDHTLSGHIQEPSARGLAVVPFAMSLELAAQAALRLQDEAKIVIGFRAANGHAWLALDQDRLDLELVVRRAGASVADVDLRRSEADGAGTAFSVRVLLSDAYPAPPPVGSVSPRDLVREARRLPIDTYRAEWLFHGPTFDILRRLDGWSQTGLRMDIEQPRTDWIERAGRVPRRATPANLLDGVPQALAYWFTQVDDGVFTAFPFRIDAVDLYRPPASAGRAFTLTMACGRGMGRFSASADVIDATDKAPAFHVDGLHLSNFQVPLSYLTMLYGHSERTPAGHDLQVGPLRVRLLSDWPVAFLSQSERLFQRALLRVAFTAEERKVWHGLPTKGARREDWLLGRIAAKEAALAALLGSGGEAGDLRRLQIVADEAGAPEVCLDGAVSDAAISIAHSGGHAIAAVSGPGEALGVDIEPLTRAGEIAGLATAFGRGELDLAGKRFGADGPVWLWTAKEAVAKALGTGLRGRPDHFEIVEIDDTRADVRAGGEVFPVRFAQEAGMLVAACRSSGSRADRAKRRLGERVAGGSQEEATA